MREADPLEFSMHPSEVDFVQACLCGSRTVVHYFQDRFARDLLAGAVAPSQSVSAIKKGPFRPLLNRPLIRSYLAERGNGVVDAGELEQVWSGPPIPLVLTLDRWGSHEEADWQQTSRPGTNLVLNVNLDQGIIRDFLRQIGADSIPWWDPCGHPGEEDRVTLGWARIDCDLDSGDALIEEVQSDWIREVRDMAEHAAKGLGPRRRFGGAEVSADDATCLRAIRSLLTRFDRNWGEIVLWATIRFLQIELGMKSVFYHRWEYGRKLKNIHWGSPPRSLYTDLPKRFCFQPSEDGPCFLKDRRLRQQRRRAMPRFWQLPCRA
jgi:hypothetical protein